MVPAAHPPPGLNHIIHLKPLQRTFALWKTDQADQELYSVNLGMLIIENVRERGYKNIQSTPDNSTFLRK